MSDQALVLRVAARHQMRVIRAAWEGKLVGKDWRLQWSRDEWHLEELPQKGKKKLRVGTLGNVGNRYSSHGGMDAFIPQNILRAAQVTPSDSYDHVKEKLLKASEEAASETVAKRNQAGDSQWDFLTKGIQWYERLVYFTEIMPEGMEPFNAEGKDFVVKVEWTRFSAYDPDADMQATQPHYTMYESSSPAAARKLYQILREDPKALHSTSWRDFDGWLKSNKISYKVHFSQWT